MNLLDRLKQAEAAEGMCITYCDAYENHPQAEFPGRIYDGISVIREALAPFLAEEDAR